MEIPEIFTVSLLFKVLVIDVEIPKVNLSSPHVIKVFSKSLIVVSIEFIVFPFIDETLADRPLPLVSELSNCRISFTL